MTNKDLLPKAWETGEASWNEEGEVRYTLHGIKEARVDHCMLISAAPVLYASAKMASFFPITTIEEREKAEKFAESLGYKSDMTLDRFSQKLTQYALMIADFKNP